MCANAGAGDGNLMTAYSALRDLRTRCEQLALDETETHLNTCIPKMRREIELRVLVLMQEKAVDMLENYERQGLFLVVDYDGAVLRAVADYCEALENIIGKIKEGKLCPRE